MSVKDTGMWADDTIHKQPFYYMWVALNNQDYYARAQAINGLRNGDWVQWFPYATKLAKRGSHVYLSSDKWYKTQYKLRNELNLHSFAAKKLMGDLGMINISSYKYRNRRGDRLPYQIRNLHMHINNKLHLVKRVELHIDLLNYRTERVHKRLEDWLKRK
jgi:hypothetical protein